MFVLIKACAKINKSQKFTSHSFCPVAKLFQPTSTLLQIVKSVPGKMRNCVVSFYCNQVASSLITLFSQEGGPFVEMRKEKSFIFCQ